MTLFWRLHFPGRLLVHIRPETCWQGLRGQFAEPCQWQKLCQDFWTWSLVQPIISDSVSPSSFDKDDAVSRREEGFYLLTAAVVDNTICRGLAQFDTKYQIYLYFYEVVFLVWNVFPPLERKICIDNSKTYRKRFDTLLAIQDFTFFSISMHN